MLLTTVRCCYILKVRAVVHDATCIRRTLAYAARGLAWGFLVVGSVPHDPGAAPRLSIVECVLGGNGTRQLNTRVVDPQPHAVPRRVPARG